MKIDNVVLAGIIAAAISLSSLMQARADDASVASSPTGDLVFVKNDSIEMLSEDLTIALNKVRVDYVFRNTSSNDITMKIGFPVPIMVIGVDPELRWRLPHDQDFIGWVDGKRIAADMNVRIGREVYSRDKNDRLLKEWVDLTEEFNNLGLDPFNADTVPSAAMPALRKMGLVGFTDETMTEEKASWDIKKTYTWTMTFPANRDVSIRHEFKPWKGSFPEVTGEAKRYCPDRNFKDALEKIQKKERLDEANVDFILKTAGNWSGPIKLFTLRIDKEGASLVSLCPIPGLKLVRSGNMFVASAKDFEPTSDLSIYFLGHGISQAREYP